jgi:hypothetical protein
MKPKLLLKILIGIVAFTLLMILLLRVIAEPWMGKKIETSFNTNSSDYLLKIDKVHISIIHSSIELENVTLISKLEQDGHPDLTGEIASVKLKGIQPIKALFKNEIDIREVTVSNSRITGKVPFPEKARPPKISTINLKIDSLFFDNLIIEIKSNSSVQSYSVKDGVLKVYDLQIAKLDTLSSGMIKKFDFDAMELLTVSPDSMYTIATTGINYSGTSNTLSVDSFSIRPNYKVNEFTARHQFQSDRFEVGLSAVHFYHFPIAGYLKSKRLVSSYIEIGKMNVNAFRDKRKAFRHVNKPAFQDAIYNYPGIIDIDSIGILSGNITYTEHVEKANEPGFINFRQLNARIYKITNDPIFKTEKGYLELKAEALLMGKGKMTTLLKARLFDAHNTFTVNGTLSGMEISEMNPMLEKNAFIFATSGKIDAMNFGFTANNTKATGHLNLLYHGLKLAVKNKQTDDTTALKERIESLIANSIIIDSNPLPGEGVRQGVIDNQRDPERFLFNYCFKSILTGIKSVIAKNPKKKEK